MSEGHTLNELQKFAEKLISEFSEKQIVLLTGTLGAGKTTLVQEVVKSLGSAEASSPTYSLIQEYKVPSGQPIYHIDLYRIEGDDDLESSGFWDIFTNDKGLVFIEWADRIQMEQLPVHWARILVRIDKIQNDECRQYSVEKL